MTMERLTIDFPLTPQQTQARQALVSSLKQDPRIQAFLTRHQLDESFVELKAQMLADYLTHQAPCANCVGLHACTQAKTGFALGIEVEPLVAWELQACRYQQAHELNTAHHTNFTVLDVGESFLEASLETLADNCDDGAYLSSIQPLLSWLKTPSHKGLYFYGAPGSGKTHLAMAIANYFAKQNRKVAVVSVPQLAMSFPTSFYENDAKDILMAKLKKAYLVVFDDIGAESYTSWFRDELLFPILNARMEAKQLTLFTSNHSPEALKNHFRFNQKADDEAVKALRMMERIQALSTACLIQGQNRRK